MRKALIIACGLILVVLATIVVKWLTTAIFDGPGSWDVIPRMFARQVVAPAIERFHGDMGRLPTDSEGLPSLIAPAGDRWDQWRGPYLSETKIPMDPWGNPYEYRVRSARSYEVISRGADGVASGDDVVETIELRQPNQRAEATRWTRPEIWEARPQARARCGVPHA
ncbi:hypothetical protein ASA1KI_11260 [Opitutales bacterium ASA1]|uniref:type II secretion system protein GspG n=1 Tax=Congregicoccus parvus TaxID=3081749 RepID=UPI002B27CC16|nr:hypothetical protein ASA1KI_11260 [Opitutales bacterium ASA1]